MAFTLSITAHDALRRTLRAMTEAGPGGWAKYAIHDVDTDRMCVLGHAVKCGAVGVHPYADPTTRQWNAAVKSLNIRRPKSGLRVETLHEANDAFSYGELVILIERVLVACQPCGPTIAELIQLERELSSSEFDPDPVAA